MTDNKKLKETLKTRLKENLEIRYDADTKVEGDEERKEGIRKGKPWTKDGVYESYKAAATRRDAINKRSPEYATKIKRCGHKGSLFKVVKRLIKEPTKKTKTTKTKKIKEKK